MAKLSLSEVQVPSKRRYIQLVAPSGPGPQLSLLRESGPRTRQALRLRLPKWWGPGYWTVADIRS